MKTTEGSREPNKKRGLSTAQIAMAATFMAVNVAVSALSSRLGDTKITLSYTVCFFGGYLLGPFLGAIIGGGADLIGCFINGFAPNPLILLSSCLLGLIPGIVRYVPPRTNYLLKPYLHAVLSYAICFVVCTAFINTMGLYFIAGYGKKYGSFWGYLVFRIGSQAAVFALNLVLTLVLIPTVKKIFQLKANRRA